MVWLEPGTQENVCVELYVVPSTVNARPAGFVCTVTWTVAVAVGVAVGVAVAVAVGVGVGVNVAVAVAVGVGQCHTEVERFVHERDRFALGTISPPPSRNRPQTEANL